MCDFPGSKSSEVATYLSRCYCTRIKIFPKRSQTAISSDLEEEIPYQIYDDLGLHNRSVFFMFKNLFCNELQKFGA